MDHQRVYCGSQWAMAEGEKSIEHRVYSESVNSQWYSIRVIHFFFVDAYLNLEGSPNPCRTLLFQSIFRRGEFDDLVIFSQGYRLL